MKTYSFRSLLLAAALLLSVFTVNAQQHYVFNCGDYISTDNSRAPQSVFSYDRTANTFSIAASGSNNVAFQMNTGLDNEYYIDNDETMLTICAENVRTSNGSAYVWWLNGFNNGGQVAPDRTFTDGSDRVLLWNLKTNTNINSNFDWSQEHVAISAFGHGFILAVGLTADDSSQPGTIKDFGYYAPWEVAAKHPALMSQLGFDAESLTSAIKAKILTLSASQQTVVDGISADDYESAYALYLQVRATSGGEGAHTGSYEQTDGGILARFDDQYVRIQFYNDSTVRVSKAFDSEFGEKSWAVIAEPDASVSLQTSEADGVVTIQSAKLRVQYVLSSGCATVFDCDGRQLIAEARHRFAETTDGPFASYTITQSFILDNDERIYGMGQLQDGKLDRRGTVVKLEQDNRSICIPYFLSSKNYGLYWDNYSPTTFNDSGAETSFRSTGKVIDYYVLTAASSHDVQRSLRHLTGECLLPPLWNFGVYQSRERYTSVSEVKSVVKKYRDLKIPFDCLVQDWQYWGDDAHWNAMEFLNPDYSNYQDMISYIHNNNAKIMISIWASFGPQTSQFSELQQKGLLFTSETWPTGAGVKPYNPYSAEARDIYWRHLYNGLTSKGIDAYWMDSTEPDFFGSESDKDNVALPGQTWRSLRNAFPLATVQGVSDHHRAKSSLDKKRISIMTRSGYLGMQRTGAYVWSADINGDWTTLRNQIPAACNLSESGLPYWNSDTGGFFGSDLNNPEWRRLYTRWTQFSCFTPMLRFHGTGSPREPWQFGSKGDAAGEFDNIVRYIHMRYRLLPYLYSTAHQVHTNAEGFMQALPIAFPADEQTYDIADQYMFGRSFLVAPVLQDGATTRNVYLPQIVNLNSPHRGDTGGQWLDFWSGYTFDGSQTVSAKAPADIIPLYVPAGSIIPWGPDVEYSTEKVWDNLEIRIYPGADGHFTLYEDEFDNRNFESGQYTEIPMIWDNATKTLTIGARRGQYAGMLDSRTFNIVVVTPGKGTGDKDATTYDRVVTYTGEPVSVTLAAENEYEPTLDECTDYIVNPSFEADGRALTQTAPQGWTVSSSTAWWGVNLVDGGNNSEPAATDGRYIFGVWDGSVKSASISQTINNLPAGSYRLTVDMHASNRSNSVRVGDQCVFAGDQEGFFRDQISSPGTSDGYAMQTISVDFTQQTDNDPVTIGVRTANAPTETWFKIDNFRLYRLGNQVGTPSIHNAELFDKAHQYVIMHNNAGTAYDLSGRRTSVSSVSSVSSVLPKGVYIKNGKKVLVK